MVSVEIGFLGTHRAKLGESPLWDADRQCLWWVDSITSEIHAADLDGVPLCTWRYAEPIGSIAHAPGGLVAAMGDGFYFIDAATGQAAVLRRQSEPGLRFNDGKADRNGRFLSGHIQTGEGAGAGSLWRLERDGSTTQLAQGLSITNAICFSPDGVTLYFGDSLEGVIRAYPYDQATGALGNRVDLIDCRLQGSGPDGATVDSQGRLWVALVLAQAVACYSPAGELLRLIDLPIPYPSCPAFGGPDLKTLFVTSIADSGHRLVTDHPDGGRVLAITGLDAVGIAEGSYRPDNHIRE